MDMSISIQTELSKARFDPHSPIPLYHQAYLFIRDLILKEVFGQGELMPTEIELAQALNIGRQTLRQAMSQLVEEGLIERFSGRGTFVCEKKIRSDFFLDRSFSQEMADLGKKTSSRVLTISNAVIDESAPRCFQNKLRATCLHLTRLRYGDAIPIGLQEAIILTERCPDLDKHDFTKESLFRVITEVYGLEISEIYHVVNAVISSEAIAKLLEIRTGDPLLLEKSVTFLADGEPIEATTSFFRADQYEYSVRFRYMGSKRISL
jgi:GntR family transcriptional regulator